MNLSENTVLVDDESPATVFVVEDNPSMRDFLRCLVESVGLSADVYASAEEFLHAHDPHRAGCLLLDIRLPGMSGVELQQRLRSQRITVPVILMTGYGEVPTAVNALKLGAFDFIQKPFNNDALLDSIRKAIALDQEQRRAALERAGRQVRLANLTQRERQIMRYMIAGKSNKVAAIELRISEKTVEAHRARVMRKLQVGSLAELIRFALADLKDGQ